MHLDFSPDFELSGSNKHPLKFWAKLRRSLLRKLKLSISCLFTKNMLLIIKNFWSDCDETLWDFSMLFAYKIHFWTWLQTRFRYRNVMLFQTLAGLSRLFLHRNPNLKIHHEVSWDGKWVPRDFQNFPYISVLGTSKITFLLMHPTTLLGTLSKIEKFRFWKVRFQTWW